jgi:hypothetical protein
MFVIGNINEEKYVFDISVDLKVEDYGSLQRNILENIKINRIIPIDKFLEEIRPLILAFIRDNGMKGGYDFFVNALGIAPSSSQTLLVEMHKHIISKPVHRV